MVHEPLQGSCSCGRNHYSIQIPDDVADHAEVYFDSSRDNRMLRSACTNSELPANNVPHVGRFHGTPITAWLRVPLDWYQSHTRAFFPDETHSSIRRAHIPWHAPHTRRIFCGFCGTPLTFWTEEPRDEADFMSVAIGSLFAEDQRALEDLNLLPGDSDEEVTEVMPSSSSAIAPTLEPSSSVVASSGNSPNISRSFRRGTADGIPWFEEMVEGSRLGRLMRARRGMGMSEDRSTMIEWEVSEWHDDGTHAIQQEDSDSSGRITGKRKRGRHSDTAGLPKWG